MLEFDYNKAMRQASQLEELASQLDRLAKKDYSESMQTLSGAWQGDSATAFLRKGSALEEDIEKTAKKLKQTAESFRKVANAVKKAEEQAKQLALVRTAKT